MKPASISTRRKLMVHAMCSIHGPLGTTVKNRFTSHERSNSALVSDVCAAALRASYNAPQRGR